MKKNENRRCLLRACYVFAPTKLPFALNSLTSAWLSLPIMSLMICGVPPEFADEPPGAGSPYLLPSTSLRNCAKKSRN
jgi:hypothetical protein